ncbi:hypothetical protein NQ314_000796 [Rhamnusium bicolor]|uniref:Uncharacterized protein n=1 Tax=Rhamnusium bicolor TaxID=1586634 RepID=A0AAV8ZTT1_9CUCU|nr:hypothetical protein NQ314_000796 [Rhamnusium bicolor]
MQTCLAEPIAKGPPQVDTKPNLLDSFIPASMQIMAHVTELMKYDLKPTTSPPYGIGSSTTSTMRPTPSHRPGVYAPVKPPGPEEYFSQKGREYDYINLRYYYNAIFLPTNIFIFYEIIFCKTLSFQIQKICYYY